MSFDDSGNDGGTLATINVTPLVDVMLVLLIIFMVASPIIQQGVELELPKETLAPVEGESEQLVVSIDKKGDVYVGEGNLVQITELGTKLNGILARRKDKRVLIKADKSVAYGKVMSAMGSIRRAGITQIGLLTDPGGLPE